MGVIRTAAQYRVELPQQLGLDVELELLVA